MSEGTKFRPGDRVRQPHSGDEYTVLEGPFTAYRVRTAGDESDLIRADLVEPIPPADPRVDVVAAALARENDGYSDPVPARVIELWASAARAVLAALDAHDYQRQAEEMNARLAAGEPIDAVAPKLVRAAHPRYVRDSAGDDWERNSAGTYDLAHAYLQSPYQAAYQGLTLDEIRARFGPLEEV